MSYGSGGYQGLGVYSGGAPRPPRYRKLKVALAVLLVLLLGGGGVLTVVRLNSGGAQQPGAAPKAPSRQDWQTVTNAEAGVSYQVPPSWQIAPESARVGLGSLDGGGIAQAYPFDCDGRSLIRGSIASTRSDEPGNPGQAAASAAQATAISGYRIGNDLPEVGPPISQPVAGNATASTVLVRSSGKDHCYATQARITGIALPLPGGGSAIVVLNVPTDGPHAEQSPSNEQVRGILDSITPLGNTRN